MKKSILYNQNFFKDRRLVADIVNLAGFTHQDIVYEIGPGRGIITRELMKTAGKVVAIELDPRLAGQLKVEFSPNPKIKIIKADFLTFSIPEKNYQVFSNIPFNLTAKIIRKLLTSYGLKQAFLVVQKEAAEKFCGRPKTTQFSVLHQPWFTFEVIRNFDPTDFLPAPGVETVLLKISRRTAPLVAQISQSDFIHFVELGFNRWRKNLGKNFKDIFTYKQWRRLAHDLKFPLKSQPTDLTFPHWLGIFNFYKTIK